MHPLLVLFLCSPVLGQAPPLYPQAERYPAGYVAEPSYSPASWTVDSYGPQVPFEPHRYPNPYLPPPSPPPAPYQTWSNQPARDWQRIPPTGDPYQPAPYFRPVTAAPATFPPPDGDPYTWAGGGMFAGDAPVGYDLPSQAGPAAFALPSYSYGYDHPPSWSRAGRRNDFQPDMTHVAKWLHVSETKPADAAPEAAAGPSLTAPQDGGDVEMLPSVGADGEVFVEGLDPSCDMSSPWFLAANEVTLRDYTLREPGVSYFTLGGTYRWSDWRYVIYLPGPHVVPPGSPQIDFPYERQRMRQWMMPIGFNLGIMPRLDTYATVPLVFGHYERSTPDQAIDTSAGGFGDIILGGKFLICEDEKGEKPTWIANVALVAPSGRHQPVMDYVDLGSGFWQIDARVLGHRTYRSDIHGAVTLFGGGGYRARLQRSWGGVSVDPGDSLVWEFGAALPLNRVVSARASVEGEFIMQTEVDQLDVEDSRAEPLRLRLELNRPWNEEWFLTYYCTASLNEDLQHYWFGFEFTRKTHHGWYAPTEDCGECVETVPEATDQKPADEGQKKQEVPEENPEPGPTTTVYTRPAYL